MSLLSDGNAGADADEFRGSVTRSADASDVLAPMKSNLSVPLRAAGASITIDDGYHTDDNQLTYFEQKSMAEAINLRAKPGQDSIRELGECLRRLLIQFCTCLSVLPAKCLDNCRLAALFVAILLGISYFVGILWVTARLGMYDIRFVDDDEQHHSTLFGFCKHGSDNMMYQKNVCDYYDFECLSKPFDEGYLTLAPSSAPTSAPSVAPFEYGRQLLASNSLTNHSSHPTSIPSNYPTTYPTRIPSMSPTLNPTEMTNAPTLSPTAPAHLDRAESIREGFVKEQLILSFLIWSLLRELMSEKRVEDKKEAKKADHPCWYPNYSLEYLILFVLKNMVSYNFRSLGFLTLNVNNCQVVRSAYYPEWYVWMIPTFAPSLIFWAVSVWSCLSRREQEDVISDEKKALKLRKKKQRSVVKKKENDEDTRLVLRKHLNRILNCKTKQTVGFCQWLMNWILATSFLYCVLGPSVCLIGFNMHHDLYHGSDGGSSIRNNSNGLSPFKNHGILQWINAFVVEIQSYFVPAFIWGPFAISTILSNVLTIMDLFITFLKLIVDMQGQCCCKPAGSRQSRAPMELKGKGYSSLEK